MILVALSRPSVTFAHMILFLKNASSCLHPMFLEVLVSKLILSSFGLGFRDGITCMRKLGYMLDKLQTNPIRNETTLSSNIFVLVFF